MPLRLVLGVRGTVAGHRLGWAVDESLCLLLNLLDIDTGGVRGPWGWSETSRVAGPGAGLSF